MRGGCTTLALGATLGLRASDSDEVIRTVPTTASPSVPGAQALRRTLTRLMLSISTLDILEKLPQALGRVATAGKEARGATRSGQIRFR